MSHSQKRRRATTIMLSLLLTTALIIPAAFLARPTVRRWYFIHGLTSADATRRELALNYVIRYARENHSDKLGHGNGSHNANNLNNNVDHERIARAAARKLAIADQTNFLQIASALDHAGQWHRDIIDDDAWVRWLYALANETDPEARIIAAQKTADAFDLFHRPDMQRLLEKLQADPNDDVRYNTLTAIAETFSRQQSQTSSALTSTLTSPATSISPNSFFQRATADANLAIANDAWLYLGLSNSINNNPDTLSTTDTITDTTRTQWQTMPPIVAGTMIWAKSNATPPDLSPAIDALSSENIDKIEPTTRAMAAYACRNQPILDTLITHALPPLGQPTIQPRDQWTVWRAVLGTANPSILQPILQPDYVGGADAITEPIIYAAAYRAGDYYTQPERLASLRAAPLAMLAVLEGAIDRAAPASPELDITSNEAMPALLRLTIAAAAAQPKFDDLYPALTDSDSAMRDLACIIMAQRFADHPDFDQLVASLLQDYNDLAKMSGAIVAGLANAHPTTPHPTTHEPRDLLQHLAQHEDIWAVQQIMQVGQWMRNDQPLPRGDMPQHIANLLTRDDLPRTTLLLAMLHTPTPPHFPPHSSPHSPTISSNTTIASSQSATLALHNTYVTALDYLLNPRGELRLDLVELLDQKRWYRVLKNYLPPSPPHSPPHSPTHFSPSKPVDSASINSNTSMQNRSTTSNLSRLTNNVHAPAPPFWVWADPDLCGFQIETLRAWWLINRHHYLTQ